MRSEQILSAKDIMNFCYCPRIIYYEHVLKIPQSTTKKELKGREKYDEFKKKSRRNKIIREFPKMRKMYDTYLQSDNLGIITKLDCVAFDDNKKEAYPIQVKYAKKPRKLYRQHVLQVILEAALVEEQFGYSVPRGFLKFLLSGNIAEVETRDKSELFACLEYVKGLIRTESFPNPTTFKKRCVDCCYRNVCWE